VTNEHDAKSCTINPYQHSSHNKKISKLTNYTLFLAKNHDEIKNKSNQNQTSDAYDLLVRARAARAAVDSRAADLLLDLDDDVDDRLHLLDRDDRRRFDRDGNLD
jgi:hypothetical protein